MKVQNKQLDEELKSQKEKLDQELKNQKEQHDQRLNKIENQIDDDAQVWAELSIKNTANEILMRIARDQPKKKDASSMFTKFSKDHEDDFRSLKARIGCGRSVPVFIEFLDSLVLARNLTVNCKVVELDENVSRLQKLAEQRPSLQHKFVNQYTIIDNYQIFKSMFPSCFIPA